MHMPGRQPVVRSGCGAGGATARVAVSLALPAYRRDLAKSVCADGEQ